MDKPKSITKSVKNMKFVEAVDILTTATLIDGVLVERATMKDYRNKERPAYSVLTIELELEKEIQEWKYDYGIADCSLQTVVDRIISSSGQKVSVTLNKTKNTVELLTPPSVVDILETYIAFGKTQKPEDF